MSAVWLIIFLGTAFMNIKIALFFQYFHIRSTQLIFYSTSADEWTSHFNDFTANSTMVTREVTKSFFQRYTEIYCRTVAFCGKILWFLAQEDMAGKRTPRGGQERRRDPEQRGERSKVLTALRGGAWRWRGRGKWGSRGVMYRRNSKVRSYELGGRERKRASPDVFLSSASNLATPRAEFLSMRFTSRR